MKNKLLTFAFLFVSFFSLSAKNVHKVVVTDTGKWKLVWNDEFNYVGLPDSSKWDYDYTGNVYGWGNNEAQYYTVQDKDNAWVSKGFLNITALKESRGNKKYTSARLITKGKRSWLYGRFEIRAKLPTGKGTWPAIWMLSTDSHYGQWPASGEIDIMENVGFDPDTIVGSAHTKKYNHVIRTQKNARIVCQDCYSKFHTYALEWDPNEYRLYVDSKCYFTFKKESDNFEVWPFNKRFYLILNLAIGGNWGGAHGVDDTIFPLHFKIDYVRVYKRIG